VNETIFVLLSPIRHGSLEGMRKGRGATRNVVGRFEPYEMVPEDDGWGSADLPLEPLRTIVQDEPARSILSTNDSPDVPFDRSINPYRGCEHGCIYCFARPSHAYLNLSPGLDFESRIFAKPTAPELLRKALRKPGYVCEPIAMGTNTDPYQPVERERGITRALLEVMAEFRHPVGIVTKSNLVLRDLDLLAPMAREGRAAVMVSITTLDRQLARRMEPRAATPGRRLQTIEALAEAGVPTGVMASPMIPGLNDHELERILESAAEAGAGTATWLMVRLPHELKELFTEWLEEHYPDRARRVLNRIREVRGGKLNDARFGTRGSGEGPYAEMLGRRFVVAVRRLGLNVDRPKLDTSAFRVPRERGDQLGLFQESARS